MKYESSSGDRLHQSATGRGIVNIIFRIALNQSKHAEGVSTDQASVQAERRGADRINELAQDMTPCIEVSVTKNCAVCRNVLMFEPESAGTDLFRP